MYTKKHYVESTEIDARFNLRLADLFRIMQDVATEDAERLSIGKADTIDKGYFWIISRYAVTIYKYPKYLETINVSTYPQGKNKFIYPRNFIITSEIITCAGAITFLCRRSVISPFAIVSTWCPLTESCF